MSDYTPTTESVREQYTREQPPHIGTVAEKAAEFDRWLSAHDADLRERIATEIEGLAKSSPYAGQFNEAVFSAADIARGTQPEETP